MTTLQLLGVGAFLMAYYQFVLRRHNTLGLRMFSLFSFISAGVCQWWYTDYFTLKSIQQSGIVTQAIVLKKSANTLEVRFTDQAGKAVVRTKTGGISTEEFAAVNEGHAAPILYSPHANTFYLLSSYQRQLNNGRYVLLFPGLLFLLGIVSGIRLRKYRINAHEGTIYEYLTDESGRVVLYDTRNSTTKVLNAYSTLSAKLFQVFQK